MFTLFDFLSGGLCSFILSTIITYELSQLKNDKKKKSHDLIGA